MSLKDDNVASHPNSPARERVQAAVGLLNAVEKLGLPTDQGELISAIHRIRVGKAANDGDDDGDDDGDGIEQIRKLIPAYMR